VNIQVINCLPEVFYGRFSAESIAELQPQIDKTLEIEKYEMPDPTYLDNVVLVAGVDATYAPTYGNGAINYVNDYYTNIENGITSYYYLYNDDSGVMSSNSSGASASIRSYISSGASFVNYTAHCSLDGWANPSFTRSHIDELTNEHMYPLIIGNCCESSTFSYNDCFAEKILMAENKGAVGYIGGSNSTYWDEDYYWGVGLASISANPTYENSGLGAYDRFFHLNDEVKQDWYVTQGQINVAGNLAVEASTSSLKAYYWEIYHLMGDPSLTPYVTVPEVLIASYNSEIITGSSSFQVLAEEDAYVAISKDGVLLDAKLVDATGTVELSFNPLAEPGVLDLVITKQNRQPTIDEITIVPATTPYVVLDYYIIDDALGNNNSEVDFGETIKLDIQLKNVSDSYDAFNVIANLICIDTNIVLIDSVETFGTILRSDSALIEVSFTINFKNKFSDQQKVSFDLEILGEDVESVEYTWNSKINLTVNAPELEIGDLLIDDSSGNDNGIFDPGETADISLIISNTGNATISNLNGLATILGGETYLTLNNSETGSFNLDAQETDTIKFNATAESGTPISTIIYMSFEIDDVSYNYYSKSVNKELSIGEIPEILISDEDTVVTNNANFYDSGGKDGNYSDYENYTITFKPEDSNKFITANFLSFNVESHSSCGYDKLMIYNGMSTEDELTGEYCGTNSPGYVTANNMDGALTFVFTSDQNTSKSGWEAEIRSLAGYDYHVTVSGTEGPVEGAIVEFNNRIDTTGVDGVVEFFNVPEGINYPLTISAFGYDDFEASINLFEDTSEEINLEVSKFDVTFNLFDEDGVVDGDITFDGKTLTTADGTITFTDVEYSLDEVYIIQSYGLEVTVNLSEDVVLKALKYDIEFIISDGTDPVDSAIVEFDNKEILTDIDGIALFEQIKMDTMLTYIVRKTGYNNIEGNLDVEKDSTANLIMSAGTATFKVSFQVSGETNPIYNAQVVLDVDTLYTNSDGIAVFENVLEANNIPYEITKEHFTDVVGTIDVAGNNVLVDTILTYESYEIIFSIDDGYDPIVGATIDFDGKSETTDSNGECVFEVIYSLNKDYSITKEGYDNLNGMINVDEDKTVELSMSLTIYHVTFKVKDESSSAMENVLVEFNSESQYTNTSGACIFDLTYSFDKTYNISKDGYNNVSGTTNVYEDTTINIIMNLTTFSVTFVVVDPDSSAIENVLVEFNSDNKYTDTNGEAVFNDVLPEENLVFTLSKEVFWDYDSTLNVVDADVVFNAQLSSTTGIIPLKENNIKIYPNPSDGIFNLEISGTNNTFHQMEYLTSKSQEQIIHSR